MQNQKKKKIKLVKEDVGFIQKIDEKLQQLKEEVGEEVKEDTTKPSEEVIHAKKDHVKQVKEDIVTIQNIEEKLQKLKKAEEVPIKGVSEIITHKIEEPQHAEAVIITADSLPESPMVDDRRIEDKLDLGRKSPKEREEDVAKIVASVAEVLKSDAPLEEFEGKIPFTVPYKSYTTELRETHITTVDSPVTDKNKMIQEVEGFVCSKSSTTSFIDEERKIAPIHEEQETQLQESKISKMIKDSNELMQATSRMIQDIKTKPEKSDEDMKEEHDDAGTVHRMLVTASSEDGGEETEICPPGTITFSRSSESSGRSSPDLQSQKLSQKSSIADTVSDATVITKPSFRETETEQVIDETKKETGIKSEVQAASDKVSEEGKSVDKKEKHEDKMDTVVEKLEKEIKSISSKQVESEKKAEESKESQFTDDEKKKEPAKEEITIKSSITDIDKPEIVDVATEVKKDEAESVITKDISEGVTASKEMMEKVSTEIKEESTTAVTDKTRDTTLDNKVDKDKVMEELKLDDDKVDDLTAKLDNKDLSPKKEIKDASKSADITGQDIKDIKDIKESQKTTQKEAAKEVKSDAVLKDIASVEEFPTYAEVAADIKEVPKEVDNVKSEDKKTDKDDSKDAKTESEVRDEKGESKAAISNEDYPTYAEVAADIKDVPKEIEIAKTEVVLDTKKKDNEAVLPEKGSEKEQPKDIKVKSESILKEQKDVKIEKKDVLISEEIAKVEPKSSQEEAKTKIKETPAKELKSSKGVPEIKLDTEIEEKAVKDLSQETELMSAAKKDQEKEMDKDESKKEGKEIKDVSEVKPQENELKEKSIKQKPLEHPAEIKQETEKETLIGIKGFSEALIKETGSVIEHAKEKVEGIKEDVIFKIEEIKTEVSEKSTTLETIVNDIGESLTKDTTKVIDEAHKEVKQMKDVAKAKIDEAKEDISAKKETVLTAIDDFQTTTAQEVEQGVEKKMEEIVEMKVKVLEATSDFKDTVIKDAENVVEKVKEEVKDTTDAVESKAEEVKEIITEQKATLSGIIKDSEATIKKDVASTVEETTKEVTDAKEAIKKDIEDASKKLLNKVDEKIIDMRKEAETSKDITKEAVAESIKELEHTKEQISEQISSQIKEIDTKTESAIQDLKDKSDDLKKTVAEEVKSLEDKFSDKKEEVSEKLEQITKDFTSTGSEIKDSSKDVLTEAAFVKKDNSQQESAKPSDKQEESKYALHNGLESVEKMVVDVLTADREEVSSPKMGEQKGSSSTIDKVEADIENIVEKGVAEVKEFMEESKDAVASMFKRDSIHKEKEEVLEQAAHDIEENYNIVSDMAKSVIFEKCEKTEEETHEKEEKILERSALSIEHDYDAVSDMAKSIVFEKCDKPPADEVTEEKLPEKQNAKETLPDTLHKEEKADRIKIDKEESDLAKDSPAKLSGKSTPDTKDIGEDPKASGKSSPALSGDLRDLAREDSGKSTPDSYQLKLDNQDSLLSGKSSPGLSGKSSPILSGALTPGGKVDSKDSLLSGKSSPVLSSDLKESKESLSGKSTPEPPKTDQKDKAKALTTSSKSSSGKSSPVLTTKEPEKDLSGKSTPDPKSKDEQKTGVAAEHPKEEQDRKEKSPGEDEKPKDSKDEVKIDLCTLPKDGLQKDTTAKKTDLDEDKPSLSVHDPTEKKLSISDVQISIRPAEDSKIDSPEDPKVDEKTESKDVDSIDSGIGADVDTKKKKSEEEAKPEELKQESIPGPSTISPAKSPSDNYSGKSTPDIADLERIKEMQETLKHEKHIPGSSTPPTVPVSPIVRDASTSSQGEEPKPPKSVAAVKESEVRSSTPGSDDYEIGASSYSDISSGQASRAPHLLEADREDSDEDDDVPGSPMSVTSQVAHSRSSSRYDFEDDRIGTKMDPMNTSFYGALPDEAELDFDRALAEHRQTRGEDLVVTEESSTYLYEITKAKYSTATSSGQSQLDQINKNGSSSLMTASFVGDLPTAEVKKDPFDSWGKPLGLPSPAPPNDNKGTPKKERKLPANVSAKNKLNDDRKRAESPSKYKNKKLSPVYVDLTYVPHHGNAYYSYVDFFKRVRARYYVFSGIEPSRDVYNALLEAKQTWEDKELEVTIIPTYDTDILGYWVAENEELLTKCKIDLSPSASRCTINLQDHETSCSAYRLEF